MSLAKRIKQAREDKGLTQGDLAALTGIRQQMISKLERGLSTKTSFILILAHALDVDAQWLGGIKEDPAPYNNKTHTQSQIKTVLQFLLLHCIDELESKSIKQQLNFIEHCLKQIRKTSNPKKYHEVLMACLKNL